MQESLGFAHIAVHIEMSGCCRLRISAMIAMKDVYELE
jgi:hypothetical protein